MAKRGPAPNYEPDFCLIAYKFCLLGATNDDLAGLFEVSLATIGAACSSQRTASGQDCGRRCRHPCDVNRSA